MTRSVIDSSTIGRALLGLLCGATDWPPAVISIVVAALGRLVVVGALIELRQGQRQPDQVFTLKFLGH